MNKNSIIPTPQIAETAALALAYSALEIALAETQSAHSLVKDAHGSLCEGADFIPAQPSDELRWRNQGEYNHQLNVIEQRKLEKEQRRVMLYGCKLRFLSSIELLSSARTELANAVNALRAAIDGNTDDKLRLQKDAARCNIYFAETLLLSTAKSKREFSNASGYGLRPHEHYAGNGPIDLAASLAKEYDRSRREWVVMFSGYGSSFRFDGADGKEVPAGPYLTFDEAREEGIAWELTSDPIGGRACLYNVRTKKTVDTF